MHKKALVLTLGGDELNDIVEGLPEAKLTPGPNENVFDKLVGALSEHFNTKQNEQFQRYLFRQICVIMIVMIVNCYLVLEICGFFSI